MIKALILCQLILCLGIYNVWLIRFNKPTAWRGGSATTMVEEFQAYGLPLWFMKVVGFLKLACATGLLVGLWNPFFVGPSAGALALLMLGAVVMHAKIKDEVRKALPASIMLLLSLVVVVSY